MKSGSRINPWLTRRRAAAALFALALVAGLALLMRDFVRDAIVTPLYGLGYLIWIWLLRVPQIAFWALFLLVGLFLSLRSLSAGPPRPPSGPGFLPPRRTQPSRYLYWSRMLSAMGNSPFSRERVVRELQALVLGVLAKHERISPEEQRYRLMHDQLDVSREAPVIQALLAGPNLHSAYLELERPRGLWAWLRRLLRPETAAVGGEPIDVAGVIAWLEHESGEDLSADEAG